MSTYLDRVSKINQDPDQSRAFNAIGSQVVLAGPGSGKTFLLTAKVAKLILEEQVRYPQKIACITFSRQLAEKLIRELQELGVYDAERMYVGTIHAFCIAEILMPGANLLPPGTIPQPFRIASEEESRDALLKALSNQGKTLPGNKYKNKDIYKDIQQDFDKFRRRYFQPGGADFLNNTLQRIESSKYTQNNLLDLDWSKLTVQYDEYLRTSSKPSIDFVQVEMLSLHLLRTQPVLEMTLAARYPWWFVDEYQDLSPLFHQMVTGLVEAGRIQVFAIGDPNQCIYEDMQGSRPKTINELAQIIGQDGSKTITLQKNYRSTQNLIHLSDCVLTQTQTNKYQSSTEDLGQIHLCFVKSDPYNLASNMVKKCHGEIAILVGTRNAINTLIPKLEQQEDLDAIADRDPDFDSKTELVEWLQKAAQWCSGEDVYFYELLPFWHGFCQPEGADDEAKRLEAERVLFNVLWKLRNREMLLRDWIETIRQNLLTESRLETFEKFRPDDVKEFKKLVSALDDVEKERLQAKTLRSFGRKKAKIFLTTFHSSKGLQFDTTIVINLDAIRASSPELRQRIAYVAVTRAKSRLYLLVSNRKGQFYKTLSQASIKGLTIWECDNNGNCKKCS